MQPMAFNFLLNFCITSVHVIWKLKQIKIKSFIFKSKYWIAINIWVELTEGSKKTVQREFHNSISDVFKILYLFGMKMGCIEFGVNGVLMSFCNNILLKYMSLPLLWVTKTNVWDFIADKSIIFYVWWKHYFPCAMKALFSMCDESIIFYVRWKHYFPWHLSQCMISNNVVSAVSKASDQPAHTRSLIRAFASRLSILWLLSYWLNTIWSF